MLYLLLEIYIFLSIYLNSFEIFSNYLLIYISLRVGDNFFPDLSLPDRFNPSHKLVIASLGRKSSWIYLRLIECLQFFFRRVFHSISWKAHLIQCKNKYFASCVILEPFSFQIIFWKGKKILTFFITQKYSYRIHNKYDITKHMFPLVIYKYFL